MRKINKHIEIARTTNGKFTSMGAKSCKRILDGLSQRYERVEVSIINDLPDLEQLLRKQPDLVFLGLKRVPRSGDSVDESATDIWLSEYLERHGINYTGGRVNAMKLDFNKEK